jgi:hypothetical protein
METIILRNVCTGQSGPTNGSFGTDFFDYFFTPPVIWAPFVVHISSVHEHEYSSTRFCASEVKQFSTAFLTKLYRKTGF